jgi:hypothetical protein
MRTGVDTLAGRSLTPGIGAATARPEAMPLSDNPRSQDLNRAWRSIRGGAVITLLSETRAILRISSRSLEDATLLLAKYHQS